MTVNLNSNFSSPSSSSSVQESSAPSDGISSLKNTFSSSTLTSPSSPPAEKLSCWTRFCNFLRDLFRKIFCCSTTTTTTKKQEKNIENPLEEIDKANQKAPSSSGIFPSLPLPSQINTPLPPLPEVTLSNALSEPSSSDTLPLPSSSNSSSSSSSSDTSVDLSNSESIEGLSEPRIAAPSLSFKARFTEAYIAHWGYEKYKREWEKHFLEGSLDHGSAFLTEQQMPPT